MLVMTLILFVISCIILVVSGSFLVKSLVVITRFLKMKEFIVAFVIMAFSTTIPELFVGISSALAKQPSLALGTVIGSNIANLTLIGGIAVILARKVSIKKLAIRKDALTIIYIAAIPMILMFIGHTLSRIDAAILLTVFVGHTYYLIKTRKKYTTKLKNHQNREKVILSVFVFLLSIGVLYASAHYVVLYGTDLAIGLMLPPIMIGLFFLALGTSLPELVFSIKSMTKNHPEFALGDLMGSVVNNSTLVLGVTAMICPITANFFLFLTSAVFMILATILFAAFIRSGEKFTYLEGIALIIVYILFILVELNIQQYFV